MGGEVIRLSESPHLSNLKEVRNWLNQRRPAFAQGYSYLQDKTRFSAGWEIITTLPTGFVIKTSSDEENPDMALVDLFNPHAIRTEKVFTGKFYCSTVSVALYDALRPVVTHPIELSVVGFNTDMNRENWQYRRTSPEGIKFNHSLLRAVDMSRGEELDIDGAYGQVDYRKSGELLLISGEDFLQYYRVDPEDESNFVNLNEESMAFFRNYSNSLADTDVAGFRFLLIPQ